MSTFIFAVKLTTNTDTTIEMAKRYIEYALFGWDGYSWNEQDQCPTIADVEIGSCMEGECL